MDVTGRELKRSLSHYLKKACAGEEVTVISRGRPLVRLVAVPPETGKEPSAAEIRRRLAMIPGIILGKGRQATRLQASHSSPQGRQAHLANCARRPELILYLDTSALVKLYIAEQHSPQGQAGGRRSRADCNQSDCVPRPTPPWREGIA